MNSGYKPPRRTCIASNDGRSYPMGLGIDTDGKLYMINIPGLTAGSSCYYAGEYTVT